MSEKIFAILFIFIRSLIAKSGYGGIVILMGIESACIPLPSELIMPFGGYLVFEGAMKLFWVATAGALGCNLGSLVAYEIGCYGGRPLVASSRAGDTWPCFLRACCRSSEPLSRFRRELRACRERVFMCIRFWVPGPGASVWPGWA
jgi:hypothetical protein